MSPGELIEKLEGLGVRLEPVGDRLRLDAPEGVISDEVRAELRQRKPEVLRYLSERAEWHTLEAHHALLSRGWVVVHAANLPGRPRVLWTVAADTEVPGEYADMVRFTAEELVYITDANLKAVYFAKKVFPGALVVEPEDCPAVATEKKHRDSASDTITTDNPGND